MTFKEKIDEIYEIEDRNVRIEKFKELRDKAEWQGLIELRDYLEFKAAIEALKSGCVTEEDIERMNSEYP